ncbi:hypothetical protein F5Y08DRAFT_317311 [Xylaria arbuscula]|nr:hypothetical protein F5Y08DRAFT_317311 [Xylaria arbuscula]
MLTKSNLIRLIRGHRLVRPTDHLAVTKFSFELPVDTSLPNSPGCFEDCAQRYHSGDMSYQQFLDVAFAHLNPLSTCHPEDGNLANLAKLSMRGSMGPVAAAFKLYTLSEISQPILSQDTINLLYAIQPSSHPIDHSLSITLAALPPLHLQIVLLAALCRGMPALAINVLSVNPPPVSPKQSLFNLRDSGVCPVGNFGRGAFAKFPVNFWAAAANAGWVTASPNLAKFAAEAGPQGGPLLRSILNTELDLTLFVDPMPLYKYLVEDVVRKGDDPSLLQEIIARVPTKRLWPALVRLAIEEREDSGVEMMAILLDCGLDINYREKPRIPEHEQFSLWLNGWYSATQTALHVAAEKGNKDAVSFLLSRGANVNEPDFYGRTARKLALDAGNHEIVEMLDQAAKPQGHYKVWCCTE